MKYIFVTVFLFSVFINSQAEQKNSFNIIVPQVEQSLSKIQKSTTSKVVKFLKSNSFKFDTTFVTVPPVRALLTFSKMTEGCFIGGSPKAINNSFPMKHKLLHFPYEKAILQAFVLKNSPVKSSKQLKKLSAGVLRTGDFTNAKIKKLTMEKVVTLNSEKQGVRMLKAGRLQVLFSWGGIHGLKRDEYRAIPNTKIRTFQSGINCIDNDKAKKIIEKVRLHFQSPK